MIYRQEIVFHAEDNALVVNGLRMKVHDDSEFAYKLTKSCIFARGGADGLVKWMSECIADDFCVAFVNKIVNWVIQNGK